jgi:NitT/TauT family transport system ATP-binding protein
VVKARTPILTPSAGASRPSSSKIGCCHGVRPSTTHAYRLGLGHFTNAYPHELSGGMRQRVAIARAFSVQPEILLADEAFGHLDEVTAAELRETFLNLARECGSTAILITHQLEEAISVGDRIVVFGKSAKLLADIHVKQWPKTKHALLREAIQVTLQSNAPDARLALS